MVAFVLFGHRHGAKLSRRGALKVPDAQRHVSHGSLREAAGGDGNGADRAPRCERSISAQCERPALGPRRARSGRGAGVSRDAALAPANRAEEKQWNPLSLSPDVGYRRKSGVWQTAYGRM